MSLGYEPARDRHRVRWRENGKQRSRRFSTRDEAEAFEASLAPAVDERPPPAPPEPPSGGGVYRYETTEGTRWRFVYRQSDGRLTTRRGF